jgi:TPR repeat protein
MARIHKIIHDNSTASRVSPKRVLNRKRAAFVFVALLVALLAAGTAAHLYQSRSRPLAQLKPALVLPDFGPELYSLPHKQDLQLFTPGTQAGGETIAREREAARLYKYAADNGNSDAQRKLASFYEFGRGGLPKDNDQALRLYKLSADQGNAAAQLELGVVYEVGRIGIQKNDEQARYYYELAAAQGNAQAQYELGRFHEYGRGGLARDYEKAAVWYHRAAEQGHIAASYRLANLLSDYTNAKTTTVVPFLGPTRFPWLLVIAGFAISAVICGAAFWLYDRRRQKLAKVAYTLVSKDTQPAGGSPS